MKFKVTQIYVDDLLKKNNDSIECENATDNQLH
jgi:hypothetical protein